MPESNISRAYELFRRAAHELDLPDSLAPEELGHRLRSLSHGILDALEGKSHDESEGGMSAMEERAKEIADDLRRVERLMRDRLEGGSSG